MKSTYAAIAFVAASGIAVFGQATQQNPAGSQPTPQTPPAQSQPATPRPDPQATSAAGQQTMTWVGCIQREADYRKAQGAGGAGVAGTGVGAGNEFVLTQASMSAGGAAGTSGAAGTAGTTGSSSFELTGSGEGQAAAHVGRRVEVSGRLKAAEAGAAGPTGGPTAGAPPRGIDIGSADLQLREIDVTTIKASTSGTCAPTP